MSATRDMHVCDVRIFLKVERWSGGGVFGGGGLMRNGEMLTSQNKAGWRVDAQLVSKLIQSLPDKLRRRRWRDNGKPVVLRI